MTQRLIDVMNAPMTQLDFRDGYLDWATFQLEVGLFNSASLFRVSWRQRSLIAVIEDILSWDA
jgi:hypothetical protein